jgi:hypothetical protein
VPDAVPRGRYLAVALTSSSRLVILSQPDADRAEPQRSRSRARLVKTIDLPFFTDNVVWREMDHSTGTSEILVAGHPSSRRLERVIHNPMGFAPSHVASILVTIDPSQPGVDGISFDQPRTVYRSDGNPATGGYPSSTTADRDGAGRLWLSGLYASGLMVCEGGDAEPIVG